MNAKIDVITYEQDRLNYFTDLMEKAQKRYSRLLKKCKDAPMLSAESQMLSDVGREAQFHRDVVEMLEKGVGKHSDGLANDIANICPDLVENGCGGFNCVACLTRELEHKGYGKQSEWISVEDRLPESGVHCLLCCDIKRCDGTHRQYVCDGYHAERWKEECYSADDECVTEYNEENDEYYLCEGWYEVINNWDDYSSIAISDTVTHWMPLPEPPKKGGAEL